MVTLAVAVGSGTKGDRIGGCGSGRGAVVYLVDDPIGVWYSQATTPSTCFRICKIGVFEIGLGARCNSFCVHLSYLVLSDVSKMGDT